MQYKKHLCTAIIGSVLLTSTMCTTQPVVLGVTDDEYECMENFSDDERHSFVQRRRSNSYYDDYECIENCSDDQEQCYSPFVPRRGRNTLNTRDRYGDDEHKEPYSSPEEKIIIISKSQQKYSTSLPLAVRGTNHRKVEKRANNAIEADIRRELQHFVEGIQDVKCKEVAKLCKTIRKELFETLLELGFVDTGRAYHVQAHIHGLSIQERLNKLKGSKQKELRIAWKVLLAKTLIIEALQKYHWGREYCQYSSEDCENEPLDFKMRTRAFYAVHRLDFLLEHSLEELEKTSKKAKQRATYQGIQKFLRASVDILNEDKERELERKFLHQHIEHKTFKWFLNNYLNNPEKSLFNKLINQRLAFVFEDISSQGEVQFQNRRKDLRKKLAQRKEKKYQNYRREQYKKDVEQVALYNTPAFQAKLLQAVLGDLNAKSICEDGIWDLLDSHDKKLKEEREKAAAEKRSKLQAELMAEEERQKHVLKRTADKARKFIVKKISKAQSTDEEKTQLPEQLPEPTQRKEISGPLLHHIYKAPYGRVHQRVTRWSRYKDVPDWAKDLPRQERDLTIAQHNLRLLSRLLKSDIKDDYTVAYNFRDRKSKSIYGKHKKGRALIATMEYDGTTYSGTIFLGIGYDEKERRDVLYHAQFVPYEYGKASQGSMSKNISKQLQECSQASDRVKSYKSYEENERWQLKGAFRIKDYDVIEMEIKNDPKDDKKNATFCIYPIK